MFIRSILMVLFFSFCIYADPIPKDYKGNCLKLLYLDENTPIALQTAVVTYKKDDKTVDLIAVVHIGDRRYYEKLNVKFKEYESLCYELVGEKGVKPNPDKANKSSVHSIQDMMKDLLGLEHQLNIINYNVKNFVHADLSPEEMQKKMEERGETTFTVFLKSFAESIQRQNLNKNPGASDIDLLEVLTNPNYAKRLLAKNMIDSSEDGLGPTLTQILVVDRNEAALAVVKEELKIKNKVGLFYGGAHMPDFHNRLIDMGYQPVDITWYVAWDMRPTQEEKMMKLLKKFFDE